MQWRGLDAGSTSGVGIDIADREEKDQWEMASENLMFLLVLFLPFNIKAYYFDHPIIIVQLVTVSLDL